MIINNMLIPSSEKQQQQQPPPRQVELVDYKPLVDGPMGNKDLLIDK
jgi:hypothetical protein